MVGQRWEVVGKVKFRKSLYTMDEWKLIEDGSKRVYDIRSFIRNFGLKDINGKKVRIIFEVIEDD